LSAGPGTVLITGGTGTLGRHIARHLIAEHGVTHLILCGRSAVGADDLSADLCALGAEVTVAACDISDRAALAALIEAIPADHPLTAVVHAAGVLDDRVLSALTPERFDTVFRPKVDGAWYLHELTAHLDLAAFVLCSSATGVLGGAAQANYAAANCFLDALAAYRRARGLSAHSLAWGLWNTESGMAGALGEAELRRLRRDGIEPMSVDSALALFDRALASDRALLLPMRVRRSESAVGLLNSRTKSVIRRRAEERPGGEGDSASLSQRLAGLPLIQVTAILLDTVREHVADVLGHSGIDSVDPDRGFGDLGIDSLSALEVRNRIGAETGLRLSATVMFDYPNPTAMADFLREELFPESPMVDSVDAELLRFEASLDAMAMTEEQRSRISVRLRELAARWTGPMRPESESAGTLESATADEMFDILDSELGAAT
jgi:NAD(P)-dependent dehydrogenase (short-subunit alcohol dehydrogenase family)/acyl carrier protein